MIWTMTRMPDGSALLTFAINKKEADAVCSDLATGDDSAMASKGAFRAFMTVADHYGVSPESVSGECLMDTCYHPDPEINAEVIADAIEAERADLAAGYPPRPWKCVCGAEHSRGHFGSIGVHRCLACGYVGAEGVMLDEV